MITKLFQAGSAAGSAWLQKHYAAIGQHGTVDIRHDYLDDTREETAAAPGAAQVHRGFTPWLARLFRRAKAAGASN